MRQCTCDMVKCSCAMYLCSYPPCGVFAFLAVTVAVSILQLSVSVSAKVSLFRLDFFSQAIEQETKKEIDAAVEEAKTAPEPPLDDLYLGLYAGKTNAHLPVRGCDAFSWHATN